ncbi:hypothetical protein O181_058544 [Austropuccinia psidii MF-1]|uniref:Uncharacterized protein n=1 Tax=Austropuccinia psidii MF-1 TaxID=1389203 RepID=A0A9Q3HXR7_9BASI|nr:hypothetical protein [Austropuccinia psidii MF-1]
MPCTPLRRRHDSNEAHCPTPGKRCRKTHVPAIASTNSSQCSTLTEWPDVSTLSAQQIKAYLHNHNRTFKSTDQRCQLVYKYKHLSGQSSSANQNQYSSCTQASRETKEVSSGDKSPTANAPSSSYVQTPVDLKRTEGPPDESNNNPTSSRTSVSAQDPLIPVSTSKTPQPSPYHPNPLTPTACHNPLASPTYIPHNPIESTSAMPYNPVASTLAIPFYSISDPPIPTRPNLDSLPSIPSWRDGISAPTDHHCSANLQEVVGALKHFTNHASEQNSKIICRMDLIVDKLSAIDLNPLPFTNSSTPSPSSHGRPNNTDPEIKYDSSEEDDHPDSPLCDPQFPYPGGPGHHEASQQTLKIIWRAMRQAGMRSFQPSLDEPFTTPENRFCWTFAFKLFLKLVSFGKYEGINLDITNEQVIWNALQNHVQHRLMSKYCQQQWSVDHKEKHKKMCRRLAPLTKTRQARVSFLLAQPPLMALIPIVEECCSDDETANEYEEERPNQPYSKNSQQKQCKILKLPWHNPRLDRIMQIIDKLRQPVDDQNPNAPKNSRSRIHNEHRHPVIEPPLIETSSPDCPYHIFDLQGANPPLLHISLIAVLLHVFEHFSSPTCLLLSKANLDLVKIILTQGLVQSQPHRMLTHAENTLLQALPLDIRTIMKSLHLDPVLTYLVCYSKCYSMYPINSNIPLNCMHITVAHADDGPGSTDEIDDNHPVITNQICGTPLFSAARNKMVPLWHYATQHLFKWLAHFFAQPNIENELERCVSFQNSL